MIRANRLARVRQVALMVVTAHLGYVCIRNSYEALRDRGASVWALSLMWCVLAASSWAITVSLLRSWRSHKTVVDAPPTNEEPSSSDDAEPTAQ